MCRKIFLIIFSIICCNRLSSAEESVLAIIAQAENYGEDDTELCVTGIMSQEGLANLQTEIEKVTLNPTRSASTVEKIVKAKPPVKSNNSNDEKTKPKGHKSPQEKVKPPKNIAASTATPATQEACQFTIEGSGTTAPRTEVKASPSAAIVANKEVVAPNAQKAPPSKKAPVLSQPRKKVKVVRPPAKKIPKPVAKSSPSVAPVAPVLPSPQVSITEQGAYPRKTYDYRNVILPPNISKEKYSTENQHLPKRFNQDQFSSLLFTAVDDNSVAALKTLMGQGADINCRENTLERTPLMYAVVKNKVTAARYLLMKGAHVNVADKNGATPLHLAMGIGNYEMIKLLLLVDANVMARDAKGRSPIAYFRGNVEDMAAVIIGSYTNPNKAIVDFTAIGSLGAVELAIRKGANINTHDMLTGIGDTPLLIAIRMRNVDMINLLVARGARADLSNYKGEMPEVVAAASGDHRIRDLIRTVVVQDELAGLGVVSAQR